jgi:hypothetical protein
MNFLKKGPELKLSEIKVPRFLEDLYLDLKERHLLPVTAILIVAIVAVPFVLGGSSDSPEAEPEGATASIGSETAAASHDLVAKSMPGLRKYQKRLSHLRAKDPFKQQGAESAASSETTSSQSSGSATESAGGTETTSPSSEPGGTETTPGSTEEGEPTGRLRYYSYAIDVRVSTGSSGPNRSQSGPTPKAPATEPPRRWTTRHNLPELTMLPSRTTPAVVYMGSTKDAKKALMLVSSDVTSIFGDGKCVLGSKTCQLLAMEPGVPETFVYGAANRVFKIELLKVHLVETGKLNRAPLGKPKKK